MSETMWVFGQTQRMSLSVCDTEMRGEKQRLINRIRFTGRASPSYSKDFDGKKARGTSEGSYFQHTPKPLDI